MVERFSDAPQAKMELDFSPPDSLDQLRVLDAPGRAARTGAEIYLFAGSKISCKLMAFAPSGSRSASLWRVQHGCGSLPELRSSR